MAHRQRFEYYGVDQAEDRRVGSDSEGERKNRCQGEAWTSAQPAEGIAKILKNRVEHNDLPRLARQAVQECTLDRPVSEYARILLMEYARSEDAGEIGGVWLLLFLLDNLAQHFGHSL